MQIVGTAVVSKDAKIGENTRIWHFAQVRENSVIGKNCIISKGCYIDHDVEIGNNVKIQNNSSIYYKAIIEDGVFIGPHVILTNDKTPRSIDTKGNLKTNLDWKAETTVVKEGASIGAGSVILPGITIGRYAMIGAGSVVTKNVSDHCLVYGNPAAQKGYACRCGQKITKMDEQKSKLILECDKCGSKTTLRKEDKK